MNAFNPKEFKVTALRECPVPDGIYAVKAFDGSANCVDDQCHTPKPAARQPSEPPIPVRKLKIEADGDFWKGITKPKIRLMGRWLERAGFLPGSHVYVTCLASGIIELRMSNISTAIQHHPI